MALVDLYDAGTFAVHKSLRLNDRLALLKQTIYFRSLFLKQIELYKCAYAGYSTGKHSKCQEISVKLTLQLNFQQYAMFTQGAQQLEKL